MEGAMRRRKRKIWGNWKKKIDILMSHQILNLTLLCWLLSMDIWHGIKLERINKFLSAEIAMQCEMLSLKLNYLYQELFVLLKVKLILICAENILDNYCGSSSNNVLQFSGIFMQKLSDFSVFKEFMLISVIFGYNFVLVGLQYQTISGISVSENISVSKYRHSNKTIMIFCVNDIF